MTTPTTFKIGRPSKWLHIVIFVAIPATLLLLAALIWSLQRIVDQEREVIKKEFNTLLDYISAQEQFLRSLALRSRRLTALPSGALVEYGTQLSPPDSQQYVYQVQQSPADIPYAVICEDPAVCPSSSNSINGAKLHAVGDFLADFYAAYWSGTYFPGPITLLTDEAKGISLSIPAFVPHETLHDPLTAGNLPETLAAILAHTADARRTAPPSGGIQWIATPGMSDGLVGLSGLSFAPGIWPGSNTSAYLPIATIFNLRAAERQSLLPTQPIHDAFLLSHEGKALVGNVDLPLRSGLNDVHFTTQGVLFLRSSADGSWAATYRVSYWTLFHANPWLPFTTLLLLLFSLAATAAYVRWHRRHVVAPMQASQDALIESEIFSRTLLDTAPVALCVLSALDGKVLFANAQARQWLQLAQNDTPLSADESLFPVLPTEILCARTAGQQEKLEIQGRYAQLAYAPTRYHNQNALLCAFVDVSAHVRHEAMLTQARHDADEANTAKSRFLSAMSHELRTPLYGVQGTLELLALTPLSDNQRQHLERLQSSTDTLMQLITDILDVRKIETGEITLSTSPFNPRLLLQNCVDNFSGAARKKGLLLFACIDTNVPACVIGDPMRLRQILNNFIHNAIKFTDAGQIVARLRCQEGQAGKKTLTFQIADSGTGISADEQQALASLFRVPRPYFETTKGAGLGLAISASLARLMHAKINVTSEAGLGSSFSLCIDLPSGKLPGPDYPDLSNMDIYIRSPHAELSQNLCQWFRIWGARADPFDNMPLDTSAEAILLDVLMPVYGAPASWHGRYATAGMPESMNHAFPVCTSTGAATVARNLLCAYEKNGVDQDANTPTLDISPLPPLRVLIVEDNPINLATLRDQLEQLGCLVTTANDGLEALGRWELADFDAVLTDLNMPGMDGCELAQSLRSMAVDVPIIGITANALPELDTTCHRSGITTWIAKPVKLRDLHLCLVNTPVRQPSGTTLPRLPQTEAGADSPIAEIDPGVIEDLKRIPKKYHVLFRDTMLADAQALATAAASQDTSGMRQSLHRIHGALLAMQQVTFAKQLHTAEVDLQNGDFSPAMCARAGQIATHLITLIERHMPD